jgi:hypothetical protein
VNHTRDAAAIAADVATSARMLARATAATEDWPGLREPADVHAVLGALGLAARDLEQITSQLARFLQQQLDSRRAAVHGGYAGDPAAAVTAVADRLEQARLVAGLLASALEDAQGVVAAIGPAGEEQGQ